MAERSNLDARSAGVTTIFIGDVPDDMDESWLKQIFSGAGKIIDVYIPRKRSFRGNQRFGFVRCGDKAEGLKAIKMWNSAQIQGHKLLVNVARFSNTKWVKQSEKSEGRNTYRVVKNITGAERPKRIPNQQNTLRLVVVDQNNIADETRKRSQPCINVSEVGNEWLTRSAIAKLSPLRSMVYMQDHLKNLGYS